ncbi:hypothetical protein POJ06DRAFT_109678 [Lipomyces tetrasporus]|uniref:Uncharacterized protein n=1 Tax=Lipomyces tetrasporus TaxID=54092 RepID=A0AAD7QSV0_9ASCO|nr:uncharacterized protein POJ06DRAFT_109678 [Lipomyces tetrasporus]KAJ8100683.1 hypothetical protein POJ06DRAFT_109678 [Lipomyces tetrasporus]
MEDADNREFKDSDGFLQPTYGDLDDQRQQANYGHFDYRKQQMEDNLRVLSETDRRHKSRVRIARAGLRIFNFMCSTVVLGLTATTLAVFNATRDLTAGPFHAWPADAYSWPTTVTLVVAAVSVALNLVILVLLAAVSWRSSSRLDTVATVFSVISFVAGIILWSVVTGSLKLSGLKDEFAGTDIWTWSCREGPRRDAFEGEIDFQRVCLQSDWTFICAILQISAELLSGGVMLFGLYRRVTKKKLSTEEQNYRDYMRANTHIVKDN